MEKKDILVLGTGGTITARMVNRAWVPGSFTARHLLQFVPEVREQANVSIKTLFSLDSSSMNPAHWMRLAQYIHKNQDKFDGVVIAHGTDTMHYTASALSFLLQELPFPVVLTGAQVPPHQTGSDARRNLLDAIRVASETDIGEVCIVFNSQVLRGNRAKKFREVEFDAFESVGMLPLGVVEHEIRLTGEHYRKKRGKLRFFPKLERKVCILKLTPGLDPGILGYLVDSGYKGIVIEGFGAGNVPILEENSFVPQIREAVGKGLAIVVSTQCTVGSSWMYLYETGKKALEAGAMPGHDMLAETALTKLMWILGNHVPSRENVRELLLKNVAGEVSGARTPKEKRIWEHPL